MLVSLKDLHLGKKEEEEEQTIKALFSTNGMNGQLNPYGQKSILDLLPMKLWLSPKDYTKRKLGFNTILLWYSLERDTDNIKGLPVVEVRPDREAKQNCCSFSVGITWIVWMVRSKFLLSGLLGAGIEGNDLDELILLCFTLRTLVEDAGCAAC